MRNYLLVAAGIFLPLTLGALSATAGDDENTKACIRPQNIKSTTVLDDKTILFEMRNGKIWQNEMKYACSGLKFHRRFTYEVHTGNLCSTDTITVIPTGGIAGPTCGLDKFTLYVPDEEATDPDGV